MKANKRSRAVAAAGCSAVLALAGCASSGGGFASQQGSTSFASSAGSRASTTNLAGQYRGAFLVGGKVVGKAYFNLTQTGTAIGGTLRLVLSKSIYREPVALKLAAKNDTVTGNAVDATSTTPCTYALTGSYNPKTFVFTGKSTPATCKGKVATFKTVERCFYDTGSGTDVIRPNATGLLEC
jgi:hypothetical protein